MLDTTQPPFTPINGHVLVELGGKYKHVAATLKTYEAKTNGIVIKDDDPNPGSLVGKRVYWQDYKEGSPLTFEGHEYAFVKYEDIQGYSNA